ncbi:MAG: c-type cytochrome [Candidatus Binatia bacterium]
MRSFALLALLAVSVAGLFAPPQARADASDTTLRFLRDGTEVKTIDRAALEHACKAVTVTIEDAYYGKRKRYRACPLADVLALGFGSLDGKANEGVDVFFRARDGYEKPASLARVREAGGYLAFADADRMQGDDPGWEPIDRKQADPGPYYVVWEKPAQRDAHRYPWPYQLAAIELSSFARRFPHIAPTGLPDDDAAWAGFRIFRGECIACHAINGEGGTIGPELNVPQSIVEYRPVEQVKAYIRNPQTFRYTSMPSHEYLTPADLDGLVAYFRAMRDRKHDPKRDGAKAAAP